MLLHQWPLTIWSLEALTEGIVRGALWLQASTRYLHKEASLADHTAGRARYLLARRYLASAAAAPVQARMQATTQAALHAAEDGL